MDSKMRKRGRRGDTEVGMELEEINVVAMMMLSWRDIHTYEGVKMGARTV